MATTRNTLLICGAKLCLNLQIIGLAFKLAVEKKFMITLGRVRLMSNNDIKIVDKKIVWWLAS